MLLERDTEVAWLHGHVDALARGCGGAALVLEGPAGVGKTTLVKIAQDRARAYGVRVVAAGGAACDPTPGALGARLAHEAGRTGPTLLTVDDGHRAGSTSLRWLSALATEVAGRDVTLLAAALAHVSPAMVELSSQCECAELRPLSPAATALLTRGQASGATDDYCAAAHALTGGVPRLLIDLNRAAADAGLRGNDQDISELERLAAPAIARALRLELGRLGHEASRLARAVAILGDRAGLGLAARVADLSEGEAAEAADLLQASGLIGSRGRLRLHPEPAEQAIVLDLPRGTGDRLHRRAARELARASDVDGAVDHLVQIDPTGDPEAARILHGAAAGAGDPARASELLERALREPPAPSLRPAVLRELGLAELALGRMTARDRLGEALGLAPGDVPTALALARSHLNAGDGDAAMAVLTEALDGVIEDRDLRWGLEAGLAAIGLVHPARWLSTDRRLEALPDPPARGSGPGARQLAAVRAFAAFRRSAPIALVRRRAMAALVDGEPDGELLATLAPLTMLITVLAGCDELALAQRLCQAGQHAADQRGDRVAATVMAWYTARCAYAAGDLHRALAGAVAFQDPAHAPWVLPVARAQEAITYLALGRPEAAATAVSGVDSEMLSGQLAYECILRARGAMRLDAGEHASAASAFGAGSDLMARYGISNPAGCHHGGGAALALAGLGALDRAREIAGAEHEHAQAFGAAGTEGRSLWVLARVNRDPDRLRTAADLLGRAGALGARAGALADLGDTLIERGSVSSARHAYREALDLADRGGAVPLAVRSRDGLRRAGARPRRPRLRGVHALTPAERRTAVLAARGLRNADVAEALFVSVKTVEGHLRAVYRKLGITGRAGLTEALAQRG